MPWYPPSTDLVFSIGETPPKTKWDKIGADLAWLYDGQPGLMMYGSAGQSFTGGVATKVLHTTVAYDRGGVTYSAGDMTVDRDGIYAISAGIRCYGSGVWSIALNLNSTEGPRNEAASTGCSAHWTIGVAAGTVFSCWATTTSTATMTTLGYDPFIVVQRIA